MVETEEFAEALLDQISVELNEEKEIAQLSIKISEDPNFPKNFTLKGMKIVIDCANGASYKSGPSLLKSLGAKVIAIGTKPNGININYKCGSTYPKKMQLSVQASKNLQPQRKAKQN